MKKITLIPILILSSLLYAQQKTEVKIKKIIEFEKSYVFKFKNMKTRKIDYFFSYKKDTCDNGLKIYNGKKYTLIISEFTIPHQNDGNTYMMGVDDFILPSGHKFYFSEYVRGLYVCQ
ncbi:hypothetical protein SAMN05444360_11222 [Chryseobacterium carnipullorum]|uniref:hypothetical protein n=1 Tax=Chryseobacterium carnipullorum TaxID=1124835 RepID=UPI000921F285|nr:hypothetical protein [Chryseobacterium carnipullorum]SHM45105.1 hypothetical protein SAMN05444360_11222 [Chryseobacterium carnipullorum]